MKKIAVSLFNDPTLIGNLQVDGQVFNLSGGFENSLYSEKVFQLIKILKTTEILKPEFGNVILFFQEKTNRKHHVTTIAVHGGDTAIDLELRPAKQNSLRMNNDSLVELLKLIECEDAVELTVGEIKKTVWNNNIFTKPKQVSTKTAARNTILSYHKNEDYRYPNQDNDDLITYLLYSWAFGSDYNYYGLEPYDVTDGFTGFGGGQSGGGGASGSYELPDPRIHTNFDIEEPIPVGVYIENSFETEQTSTQALSTNDSEIIDESVKLEELNDNLIDDEPLDLSIEIPEGEPYKADPFPSESVKLEENVIFDIPIFDDKNLEKESQLDTQESNSFDNESKSYDSENYDSGVSGTSY